MYQDQCGGSPLTINSFIRKLIRLQKKLEVNQKYKKLKNPLPCQICQKKNITNKIYRFKKFVWDDGYKHYIHTHHHFPQESFISMVLSHTVNVNQKSSTSKVKIPSKLYQKESKQYIKIDKNQLMIMDALYLHGSYTKKYFGEEDQFKYSEHAGLLEFKNHKLDKIIISSQTQRVDRGDDGIYLPSNIIEAYDYEYIFHTHPATPKPGGRVNQNILYEFPSANDILHFIEHFNHGKIRGSLVVAPEGLYVIRKKVMNNKPIKIPLNYKTKKIIDQAENKAQVNAIKKYGTKFTTEKFYQKIAQDKTAIKQFNQVLNQHGIHIDYFPRKKNRHNKWYLDTVYLLVNNKTN